MASTTQLPEHLAIGPLKIEIHPTRKDAGIAAAQATATALRKLAALYSSIAVIFATGASQLETLEALTSIPDLPWPSIQGFHLDEYVGLSPDHRASFRRYLKERLTGRVTLKSFLEVDGNAPDLAAFCREYATKLRLAAPQICLLGIGENGHLAFNDPPVADFKDPLDVKVVDLDQTCRAQQAAEGWFGSIEEVPAQAITVTIPALLRVPRLIVSVPGPRKAEIIRRTLAEPVATACPATILRTHPNATLYLDTDSAALIDRALLR